MSDSTQFTLDDPSHLPLLGLLVENKVRLNVLLDLEAERLAEQEGRPVDEVKQEITQRINEEAQSVLEGLPNQFPDTLAKEGKD